MGEPNRKAEEFPETGAAVATRACDNICDDACDDACDGRSLRREWRAVADGAAAPKSVSGALVMAAGVDGA